MFSVQCSCVRRIDYGVASEVPASCCQIHAIRFLCNVFMMLFLIRCDSCRRSYTYYCRLPCEGSVTAKTVKMYHLRKFTENFPSFLRLHRQGIGIGVAHTEVITSSSWKHPLPISYHPKFSQLDLQLPRNQLLDAVSLLDVIKVI